MGKGGLFVDLPLPRCDRDLWQAESRSCSPHELDGRRDRETSLTIRRQARRRSSGAVTVSARIRQHAPTRTIHAPVPKDRQARLLNGFGRAQQGPAREGQSA